MKSHSDLITQLTKETDPDKLQKLTKEIIKDFENLYEIDDFYKIPIQTILDIIQKVDFATISNNINVIQKIILKTTKFNPNNSVLILHNLQCKYLILSIEDCVKILSCFNTCELCIKLGNLFNNENQVTLDYEYELEKKAQQIEKMKDQMKSQDHGIVKPTNFEPNIIKASKERKLNSVKFIIGTLLQNDDKTKVDSLGRNPLHIACLNGDLPLVQYLVEEAKSDLDARSHNGYNPLHCACEAGDLHVVQYLIQDAHADKEACTTDYFKYTPLHIACMKCHLPIVEYLIESAHVNKLARDQFQMTALHIACEYGQLPIVQYLIEKASFNPDEKDARGRTPLHVACEQNQNDVINYLIKTLNINSPPTDFESNIHIASEKGNLENLQYLIEQIGVNKDYKNINGLTPLHVACREGYLHIVQYLIEKQGANKEAKTKDIYKYTPLLFACASNNIEVVIYLIDKAKANIEAIDGNGNSVLHLAALQENIDMIKFLVSRGASKKVKNNYGQKPSSMTNNLRIKLLL